MRKITVATGLIFLLNFAGQSQTKKTEIADPSGFQKIETTVNIPVCRESLKTCGEKVLTALDLAGFGGPDTIKYKTETFAFGKGVSVYLTSITGFEDDSVSGERLRIAFIKTKSGYRFVQIGKQFQCVRGKYAGKWTKEICP